MENYSTIQERIKLIAEKLYDGNITAMAKATFVSRTTISSIIGEKEVSPGYEVLRKLAEISSLNLSWLITGKGEMLKKTAPVENIPENAIAPYPVKPFIDSAYAVCGTPSGFGIAIKEDECAGLSLPFMKEYDFSIRAKGDSMINRSNPARSIRDGDIVVCKLWTSRSHVRWGEVYALATSDGIVVKKIMPADKESVIKCVSFNEEDGYPPYELPLQEVYDWAIVVGVVSARNWN